jgi:hypothetical protein
MGGKHRRLFGGAEAFVDDTIESFRNIALHTKDANNSLTIRGVSAWPRRAVLYVRTGAHAAAQAALLARLWNYALNFTRFRMQ